MNTHLDSVLFKLLKKLAKLSLTKFYGVKTYTYHHIQKRVEIKLLHFSVKKLKEHGGEIFVQYLVNFRAIRP